MASDSASNHFATLQALPLDSVPNTVTIDTDFQFDRRLYLANVIANIHAIFRETGSIESVCDAYFRHVYRVSQVYFIESHDNEFAITHNAAQIVLKYPAHLPQLMDIIDSIPNEAISIISEDIFVGPDNRGEMTPREYFILIFIAHIERKINIEIFKPRLVDLLPSVRVKSGGQGKIKFS